ncbi:ACP phosphodiesterase [Christiangramia sp. OXR-203]|jgi:acyl carrier protein phosphodiesterase|uniref:acyl carrier protein phosphodiesterase n=1 Tax=Christiangramia sp. OXR-203 TaxID=3100176 RepID=UPI002AC8B4FC|nr:ACP phosphodiesterase [Christiangramia sp. OXR-203]WPY99684.1 ACP phosphodiesterase [Christiangramia sp. OXR-203]
MNFLAHIYLSGDDDLVKIGNFMADSIKGKKYLKYGLQIQKGIILHRAIDFYTDTHPVFKESSHRLSERYRHYSGIIVDIFYDHFLAANWKDYCDIPLAEYTIQFYELLKLNYEVLPSNVKNFLPYMIEQNWLLSYASIDGIQSVLNGMNKRTKLKSGMDQATDELELYYDEFENEFRHFFEDVLQFSQKQIREL